MRDDEPVPYSRLSDPKHLQVQYSANLTSAALIDRLNRAGPLKPASLRHRIAYRIERFRESLARRIAPWLE